MYLLRAAAVWLVIITVESCHGIVRTLLLAPLLGDLRARQLAVLTGSLLIFTVAYFLIRWIKTVGNSQLFIVGVIWVVLTIVFEFLLGRFVFDYSWNRLIEDYDLSRGGLLGIGLLFMLFAPKLAHKLREVPDR